MTASASLSRTTPSWVSRLGLGPWRCAGLGLVVLVALVSHIQWWRLQGWPHGLLALAIGVILLILVDGLVAFVRGTAKRPVEGLRWLGQPRTWIGGLYRLALLVTVLALFYSLERWRGQWAWADATRAFAARGEDLQQRAFPTNAVPAAQNFAALPLFESLVHQMSRRATYLEDLREPDLGELRLLERWDQLGFNFDARQRNRPRFAPWLTGESTDLRAWWRAWPNASPESPPLPNAGRRVPEPEVADTELPARLLERLEKYRPWLDEVRAGSERPYCRFPLEYSRQLYEANPALPVLNGLITVLRLRASALLAAGRHEEALADVELLLRLFGHSRQQLWALGSSMRLITFIEGLQPIWEGLRKRAWTPAQVASLQARLEQLEILGAYPAAVRNEALAQADMIESFLPTASDRSVTVAERQPGEANDLLGWIRRLYPSGWSLQVQSAIVSHYLEITSVAIDIPRRVLNPMSDQVGNLLRATSDPLFPIFLAPKTRQMFEDARVWHLAAQASADLATVACALERFRADHDGAYPASLRELQPRYASQVPHDLATGEPLQYARTADGATLYAVGLDRRDDGGRAAPRTTEDTPGNLVPRDGDWVWKLAP